MQELGSEGPWEEGQSISGACADCAGEAGVRGGRRKGFPMEKSHQEWGEGQTLGREDSI